MALNLGPLNVLLRLQGADKFKRDVNRTTGAIGGVTKALGGLALGLGAIEISRKSYEFAKSAATLEDATRIFKQAGGNLQELRKATQGMVDDFSLVKQANLARTMGIPTSAMGTFAKAAIAASKSTGESVDFMLDSIVRGVARSSPMILDNLGLIVSLEQANQDYAKTLGTTADKLTEAEKKQAFLNAALKAAEPLIKTAEDSAANSADAFARFETAITNIGSAIGTGMAPAVRGAISLLEDLANSVSAIYAMPTTGRATKTEAERMRNAQRQVQVQRMLETGLYRARYAQGHPLAGLKVSPTMAQAQGATREMIASSGPGKLAAITEKERAQLQAELNALREQEKNLISAENKEREKPTKAAPRMAYSAGRRAQTSQAAFDAARAEYLREIAPTDFESAAPGLVDALAKIGYQGAIAVQNSVSATFTPTIVGNVISPLAVSADALVKKQAEAAEAAAALGHRAKLVDSAFENMVTELVGTISKASASFMGGTMGATFGPQIASAFGGAIGAMLGSPQIGSAIGGAVGEIFGPLFDVVAKSVEVFKPIIDIFNQLAVGLVLPMLVAMAPGMESFARALEKIVPLVEMIGVGLGFLDFAFSNLRIAAENLVTAIGNVLTGNIEGAFTTGMQDFFSAEEYLARVEEERAKILSELNGETNTTAARFRELNEELTNVPTGIKRLRAFQFGAMQGSGRGTPFGQSAFGV